MRSQAESKMGSRASGLVEFRFRVSGLGWGFRAGCAVRVWSELMHGCKTRNLLV